MQNNIGPDGLTPNERFIQYAIGIGAIEFVPEGRKLKSGRVSPYFFNSGLFNTGETIWELGKVYAAQVSRSGHPDVIYGPAYKGIPLSVATAIALSVCTSMEVDYAFNRKEEKTHGDGGTIVGASLAGKNVLVVDDVMTTGTSSGEAVEIIRAQGGNSVGCVIAFDRQERGKDGDLSAVQEFQKNYEMPVYAAATLADLVSYIQKLPEDWGDGGGTARMLDKILAYQKEYGVS